MLLGPASSPTGVWHIGEGPDGRAALRDAELAWALDAPLEAATLADLPEYYRRLNLEMTILPPEEVTDETWALAHARMIDRLTVLLTPAPQAAR